MLKQGSTFRVLVISLLGCIATGVEANTLFKGHEAALVKRQTFPGQQPVLFSCGVMFNSSMDLLFPPSKQSVARIYNVTKAAIISRESIALFCRNQSVYTQCVEDGLRNPTSPIDVLTKQVVNVPRFPSMIASYCQMETQINDNFMCTYYAVKEAGGQCGVGMEELLTRIAQLYEQGQTNSETLRVDICSTLSTDFECTWNLIGQKCGSAYAQQMLSVYKGLIEPSCLLTRRVPTDILPCFATYSKGVQVRAAAAFGNQSAPPTPPEIMAYISNEADIVCSSYQPMIECAIQTLDKSTNSMDLVLKTLLDYKRLQETFGFGCSLLPDAKKHAACALSKLQPMIAQPTTVPCLQTVIRIFQEFGNNSMRPPLEGLKETYCRGMDAAMACFKPVIAECDASFANKMEEFVWRLVTCRDPVSSASMVTVTMRTIYLLFTLRAFLF